jgi:hypothetical protein
LANNFNAVNDFKFASPKDFIPYYEVATDQFSIVGFALCFLVLIWVEVVIIKTKQLFWLWIPFLFVVLVAVTLSYHQEHLFHFKKENGLWEGGFSLSYFVCAGIIFIAGSIILLNYFVCKNILKKIKFKK